MLKEELLEQNRRCFAVFVESANSCFIMLSENEDKLGTLALAVPAPKDLVGSVTSSVLLGDRNVISARLFAEYLASKKGKIAIVSIHMERPNDTETQSLLLRLVNKVLQNSNDKENL